MSSSPILFEIFIDSILDKLSASDMDSYLFVDDLAVITKDEDSMKKTIEILMGRLNYLGCR